MIGETFGWLKVIAPAGVNVHQKTVWLCRCECGKDVEVVSGNLKSGNSKSCGCKRFRNVRSSHRMSNTRTYRIWAAMLTRCCNPSAVKFARYGGRGISVCDRWFTFENFFEDMGDAPAGMSIDRIDNNGNYDRENCRWATADEQANNKESTILLEHAGESMSISDWAKRVGIGRQTLYSRIFVYGWPVEKALFARGKRQL